MTFMTAEKAQSQVQSNGLGYDVLPYSMDRNEMYAICSCISSYTTPINVLEWGSGNSTLYFSNFLPASSNWKAIEHNPEYAKQVTTKIKEQLESNVEVECIKSNLPYIEGIVDGDFETFKDYVLYPKKYNKTFDIIIVDGRARVDCMAIGWDLLDKDGIMILHDAQRVQYQRGIPDSCYYFRIVNPNEFSDGLKSTAFMCKSRKRVNQILKLLLKVVEDHILFQDNFRDKMRDDGTIDIKKDEIINKVKKQENRNVTQSDTLRISYENLWEDKLRDQSWLKNDGKGRVENCVSYMKRSGILKKNLNLLDVGCGRGTLGILLDNLDINLYGIDISRRALEEASKVYMNIDCINLNLENLPYEDNFFDIAVTLDVIEHVVDPIFFLSEIFRVLKGGGRLILSTPNILYEGYLKYMIKNRRFPKTSLDKFPYDGGHLHFFTYQDIFDLLNELGLKSEPIGPRCKTFDYEFKEPMVWILSEK